MRVKKRFGAALVVAAVLVCASGATTAFADDLASTETPVVSDQPTESTAPVEETPQDVSTEPQSSVSAPVSTPVAAPEPEKVEETQQAPSSEPSAEESALVVEEAAPSQEPVTSSTEEVASSTEEAPSDTSSVVVSEEDEAEAVVTVTSATFVQWCFLGQPGFDGGLLVNNQSQATVTPAITASLSSGAGDPLTFTYNTQSFVLGPNGSGSIGQSFNAPIGTYTVTLTVNGVVQSQTYPLTIGGDVCGTQEVPAVWVETINAEPVDNEGARSIEVNGTVSMEYVQASGVRVVVTVDGTQKSEYLTVTPQGAFTITMTGAYADGTHEVSAQAYLVISEEEGDYSADGDPKSTSVEFVTPEVPGTKVIDAKVLGDYECNVYEWHFVITQTSESQAPSAITVEFANGEEVVVPLDRVTGKTAHYTTTENLDSSVVSASAGIDEDWSGHFNLSQGPCAVTPVTYKAPVPVAVDLCGVDDDAIVIPEYDASKGFFTLYGEKVAPGTYGVIGPQARVAFQFVDGVGPAEGSFLGKVYEYAQKPCDVVPPTENPNPNPNTPDPTPVTPTPTPVPAGNGGGSDKGSSDGNLAATGLDASSLGYVALGALGLMVMGAALHRRRSA